MSIRVAIIEDNNMMRYMLRSYLNEHFEVADFENGLAFFEWLEYNDSPDIVVTDLNMPEINGFELTSTLKSSQLFNKTAVIVLSGVDDSNDRIKCLELGANDYLTKPFNPKELLIKIQKITQNLSDHEEASSVIY